MSSTQQTVDVRVVAVGFIAAAVVLGLFVWFVGLKAVLDALFAAKAWVLPFVVLAAVLWLFVWSLSLGIVLTLLDVPHTRLRTFATYLGIVFSNSVTPFAQAGAEPLAALIVSRSTRTRFEVSLSAVASVDALNVIPSVGLATVSLLYLTFKTALDPRIEEAAVLFLVVALVVGLVSLYAWNHREKLKFSLQRLTGRIDTWVERITHRSKRIDAPEITERVEGFVTSLERISSSPRRLAVALGFSTLGWAFLALTLWLSLYSLGYPTPFEVSLFVVPVAVLASITPLPGGVGGVDAAYIFLLNTLLGISIPTVTAGVLIFRSATYLLPLVAGGGAIAALNLRRPSQDFD